MLLNILFYISNQNTTMKQLLFIFTFFISLASPAQEKTMANEVFIGFNFSPDYSFRTLNNTDGSASSDLVIKSRNNMEIAKFGYTTGLHVSFNLLQHVGFETGIQLSNKGYKTKTHDLVYSTPTPAAPVKAKTKYDYQYIGIPVKARFSFGKERLRFSSGIGFTTNFLLNATETTSYEFSPDSTQEKSQSSTSRFNTIDISPMVSIGIDYTLNNRMHLIAEPTFRYGLIKTSNTPVAENLYSAGLNLGIYYAFK
jgi:hypothetical protein